MLMFLSQNLATILVGAGVIFIVALAAASLSRDKKKGVGCGNGCTGCSSANSCGEKEE